MEQDGVDKTESVQPKPPQANGTADVKPPETVAPKPEQPYNQPPYMNQQPPYNHPPPQEQGPPPPEHSQVRIFGDNINDHDDYVCFMSCNSIYLYLRDHRRIKCCHRTLLPVLNSLRQ